MARRKKRAEEPRELTRKEIRLSARDRERNRKLLLATGVTIGIALLVILAGILNEFVFKPNSTLAKVEDTKIVTRDYWKRVYLQQAQLQNQLVRLVQLEEQFGGQGFFTSQINQIQATLSSPFSLGVQVLDSMINEAIVSKEAAARGIVVSEEEIDEQIREEVAAGQNAVTVPQATATAEAAVDATATAEGWTPTPVPTIDISTTITATATPIPTNVPPPTLPLLNDESFSEGLGTLEDNLQEVAGMSLQEYHNVIRARLLASKLEEIISQEEISTTEEQVQARHILLRIREPELSPTPLPEGFPTLEPTLTPTPLPEGFPTPTATPGPRSDDETKALAEDLRQRLLDGEDFATLAEEYSDDPGSAINGGDLGWFGPGVMVPPFEEAAFALAIAEISEPIKSDFGYHIIEVLDKDSERPKDEATLERERQEAYGNWLRAQVAAAAIERPDDLVSSLPSNLEANVPIAQPIQQQQQSP